MNLVQLPSVVQAAIEDLRSIGTYASFYKSWPAQWEKISGDVVDPAKVADFHSKVALPYLQHLIDDTSARFTAANVVSAFQIFCPANIPSDESALSEYGDAQLDILFIHYGTEAWAEMCDEDGFVVVGRSAPLVDADECRRDWNSFRKVIAAGWKQKSFTDLNSFLAWFDRGDLPKYYEGLTFLLRVAATLPVGSCSVERSFSTMKLVKTRLRSRLLPETLEGLLITAIEGPDRLSETQLDAVLDRFKAMRPRHVAL